MVRTLPIDAQTLTAGPRGRRLLLELVVSMDEQLRLMVFHTAYELDPGKGRTVHLVTLRTDGENDDPTPSSSDPRDIAERIGALDAASVTVARMEWALRQCVDSARYWQDPDGWDVLAAHPVVRRALKVFAAGLADRTPSWWSSGIRDEQWMVGWSSLEDRPRVVDDPRGALARWASDTRESEEAATHDRPDDPRAHYTGIWWSAPTLLTVTTGVTTSGAPAGLTLEEDRTADERSVAIAVSSGGRVLEIATANDWAELCVHYPLDVTASRRHDWFRATGREGRWVQPDWSRAAEDWDAVHLSAAAYLALAGKAIDVGVSGDQASVIAGWAPDATYWLTDVIGNLGEDPVEWDVEALFTDG